MLLLVFLGIAGLYLETGFVRGKFKEPTAQYLQTIFKQKVDFDRIIYLPLWGISIDGFKIASEDGLSQLSAQTLRLRIPLLPLFLQKKIIVSEAILNRPYIVCRAKTPASEDAAAPAQMPIQQILKEGVDPFLPENVYLENIIIRKGTIHLRDSHDEKRTLESAHRIMAEIDFRRKPFIGMKGSLYLGQDRYSQVFFEGKWDLKKKRHELNAKGTTQKMPEWLKGAPVLGNLLFQRLRTDFEVTASPQKEGDGFNLQITTKKSSGRFKWKDHRFRGKFSVRLDALYDAALGKTVLSKGIMKIYEGSLRSASGAIWDLESMKGTFFFDAQRLRFSNLHTRIDEIPTLLSGKIGLTEDRPFLLKMKQETKALAFLDSVLPEVIRQRFDPASLQGNFELRAELEGVLDEPQKIKKTAQVTIRNAEWKSEGVRRSFSRINGVATLQDQKIQIKNLFFTSEEDRFLLNGVFETAVDAISQFSLKHPKFTAQVALLNKTDSVELQTADINWGKSVFHLNGFFDQKVDIPFQLTGNAVVDLQDLKKQFQNRWKWLKTSNPLGQASAQIRISGNLLDRSSYRVNLMTETPTARIYERFPLQDAKLDLEFGGNRVRMTYGKARIYDGEIRFTGEFETRHPRKPFFAVKLSSMDVDLSRAVSDFPFLDEKFSGLMSLNLELKGEWGNRETFIGKGDFNIRHGHLFTTPLFKDLKNLMFVRIEGIDNLTFNNADGMFAISKGVIRSKNTLISSPLINIEIVGTIGLDQSLALYVNSRFTQDVIRESYTLGGFTPYVVGYAEQQITKYFVTGTLKKPIYEEV